MHRANLGQRYLLTFATTGLFILAYLLIYIESSPSRCASQRPTYAVNLHCALRPHIAPANVSPVRPTRVSCML